MLANLSQGATKCLASSGDGVFYLFIFKDPVFRIVEIKAYNCILNFSFSFFFGQSEMKVSPQYNISGGGVACVCARL